ncbi:MAG: enoyl-CoA hydratase-related protein [Thermodesulfobacteriota bacterium]|jgi:2-(1,2-epoxy-1,2-dihydrophenyl)acetyl-CoA isomerase
MEFDKMFLKEKEGIATLTLNNPDKLNAMSTEMWNDFRKIIDHLQGNHEIKVLVITGSGRGFCSGSDVGSRLAANIEGRGPKKTQADLLEGTGYAAKVIRDLELPIIAAINGVAAGAGLSMALLSDIRIASETARFGAIWVRVGLIGDLGATLLLPQLIGPDKAFEMLTTGIMIDAREAERIGLVTRVVPSEALMTTVYELAMKLAKGPALSVKLMKKALYKGLRHNDLLTQLDFESFAQGVCRQSEDHREGVRAFMEKRVAQFKGL